VRLDFPQILGQEAVSDLGTLWFGHQTFLPSSIRTLRLPFNSAPRQERGYAMVSVV
jgi:hypothetical protein